MGNIVKGLTFGADPELMVTRNGVIVNAIGLVGGTKAAPIPVENGAVQEDNVLAEFNIDPCSSMTQFVSKIKSVRKTLHSRLGDGYSTVAQASHEFNEDELMLTPEAFVFGCDPDFNAWTMRPNRSPDPEGTFRTAGGHIHIGYENPDEGTSLLIARACDVFLGVPSVLMDADTRRKELYGKAGAFRMKPYGVEYRTLSNFWLGSDKLIKWAYRNANRAAQSTDLLDGIFEQIDPADIQAVINTGNKDAAKYICETLNLEVL